MIPSAVLLRSQTRTRAVLTVAPLAPLPETYPFHLRARDVCLPAKRAGKAVLRSVSPSLRGYLKNQTLLRRLRIMASEQRTQLPVFDSLVLCHRHPCHARLLPLAQSPPWILPLPIRPHQRKVPVISYLLP